jgi:hypothetical protein
MGNHLARLKIFPHDAKFVNAIVGFRIKSCHFYAHMHTFIGQVRLT